MFITVLDWIGRYQTLHAVCTTLIKNINTLHENEVRRLEDTKNSFIKLGFSTPKAAIYAAYELGYLDTDPETVCRINGIQ